MYLSLKPLFLILRVAMACALLLSTPLAAQTTEPVGFDLSAWEKTANRAEDIISTAQASSPALETLRSTLAEFRTQARALQDSSQSRIKRLQLQMEALGAAPAEGASEAPEVAQRRRELTAQLTEARAPVLAAQEAYSRADGMIGEIDGIIRSRITDQFLTIGVSPINPANWPEAISTLTGFFNGVSKEIRGGLASETQIAMTKQHLPLSVSLFLLGLLLMLPTRKWVLRLVGMVPQSKRHAENEARALFVSTARVIFPLAGLFLITEALNQTGLVGLNGEILLSASLVAAFFLLLGRWLGGVLFSDSDATPVFFDLDEAERTAGERLGFFMGFVAAFDAFLFLLGGEAGFSDASVAVLAFPAILGAGVLLVKMGRLLDPKYHENVGDSAGNPLQQKTYQLVTRGIIALGLVGPLLAAVGYYTAATALVFPAIKSLALFGTGQIVFRFLNDLFDRVSSVKNKTTDDEPDAGGFPLLPVFLGFVLICVSVPVLALIWGARVSDIQEIWARVNDGISFGGRHVSISDFLLFAIVFAAGYTATRLMQSWLRNSVLPHTKLDSGGRNAIVTGMGYVGIFLAAMGAITAAGIDLSGIALVAGALSVGIGFGLQTIVSNFVSGVILLIERPIKEGDWISVGAYEGTVRKISVRATEIQTFDRATVVIPNADFISGAVTNYTHSGLNGRVKVPVGVAYDSDPEEVANILMEVAESHDMIDKRHSSSVVFMGFGSDSLNFEIRAILKDVNNILSVRSDMNYEILRRFREAGIEIPFAQRDINLRNIDALGAAMGKAVKPAK